MRTDPSEAQQKKQADMVPCPQTIAHIVGESLLASGADAIVAADKGGKIIFWNPGAERIFGYSAATALGASLDIIIPEKQRDRHWEGYRRVVSSGVSRYGDGDMLAVPGIKEDGSRLSLEFTIALLRESDNRVVGVVAVLRDVTKRFEEVRELRRKLSVLTGRAGWACTN